MLGNGDVGIEVREELIRRVEERLLKKYPQGEFIAVGQEFCPNCIAFKELYQEEIDSGSMKYYDIESPEGKVIEGLFDIEDVPFILFHDVLKDEYKKCELKETDDGYELQW
jgi:hypothetical protein